MKRCKSILKIKHHILHYLESLFFNVHQITSYLEGDAFKLRIEKGLYSEAEPRAVMEGLLTPSQLETPLQGVRVLHWQGFCPSSAPADITYSSQHLMNCQNSKLQTAKSSIS